MAKIGILYICTGDYVVFWEDFYESFKKNFCTSSELHFFVFSDRNMDFSGKENVHFYKTGHQPWPLVTLMRFHTFLSAEQDLKACDFLFFFNSNMKCVQKVDEKEVLPDESERLVFVRHPGYWKTNKIYVPYDRNPKSTAFIPYSRGSIYVIGAVEGGRTADFLEMCRTLKGNIETDLKSNVIARWHDESHVNHYIHTLKKYRLLSPSYCYPVGFDLPVENKIAGVSKQDKFDVKHFKNAEIRKSFFQKIYVRLDSSVLPVLRFLFSALRFEKIR